VAHGEQSRASPRRHPHLPVRVLNMGVCSLGRDPESPGDLLGLQPLGEEADNGAFSRGQPGRPAQLGAFVSCCLDDGGNRFGVEATGARIGHDSLHSLVGWNASRSALDSVMMW
jgi:hypothetical protein